MTPTDMAPAPSELEIRASIRGYYQGLDVLLVEEFWIPQYLTRADVVAVSPEAMVALEIKSDRDTLKRLPQQVQAYSQVFDRCALVCAERHLEQGLVMVPWWWGVLVPDAGPMERWRLVQRTRVNPGEYDRVTLVRIPWKAELQRLLRERGRHVTSKDTVAQLREAALADLTPTQLRDMVRRAVRERDPNRVAWDSARYQRQRQDAAQEQAGARNPTAEPEPDTALISGSGDGRERSTA